MTEPAKDIHDIRDPFSYRSEGTTHHHDRQSEIARGFDLGGSRIAAGVASYDNVNAMIHQHRAVAGEIERPTRHDYVRLQQRQGHARRIHQPNQIMMLRMRREHLEMLPPNTEEHPAWRRTERLGRSQNIVDLDPVIAGRMLPGCPLKCEQRHVGHSTGRDRVRAHLRREGMGGIDNARDILSAEIVDQAIDAAKASDTPGDRRRCRVFGAAGIGQDRIDGRILCDLRRQPIGVGGAAEDQNPQWFGRGGRHGRQR